MHYRQYRLGLVAALLLTGCASSFRPVNRQALRYQPASLSPGLEFSFNREALWESRNPKYQRSSQNVRTVVAAVKLKNKSDRPLSIASDLDFFVGTQPTSPAPAEPSIGRIRQSTGLYALYLTGAPLNPIFTKTSCNDFDCDEDVTFIPVGIIVAPVLMGINMSQSSSANAAFRKEIVENDLLGKALAPGQELGGYLVFPKTGSGTLFARINTDTTQPPPSAAVPEWEDAPMLKARNFK